MLNTRKLVLVIPSLHPGGMERVMSELAGFFASKPYIELHLVLYGIKSEVFYQLPINIKIHKPDFEFDNSRRIVNTLKTLKFLRKKLSSLKPDAILSFGEYWNSFVLLSLLGKRIPVFISDRSQPDKHLGKVQEFLRQWLYPKAAGIIAQTETAKNIYKKSIKHNNISVIGNPIRNLESDNTIAKENIVLSVGRLIKTKHHNELIKLFVKINKHGWKLVIVGDDALKEDNMQELQHLVNTLKATGTVLLAGKQTDVESYYHKSKIFAFTSSSEGFPNVVGEAQSASLPVIAFDCVAGPADMITNGENGILIPLFEYGLFEQKLMELMEDEGLRNKMGIAAKKSIEKFNVLNIGSAFENFIFNK